MRVSNRLCHRQPAAECASATASVTGSQLLNAGRHNDCICSCRPHTTDWLASSICRKRHFKNGFTSSPLHATAFHSASVTCNPECRSQHPSVTQTRPPVAAGQAGRGIQLHAQGRSPKVLVCIVNSTACAVPALQYPLRMLLLLPDTGIGGPHPLLL